MKLYIRFMVSMHCKMIVKEELRKLGLHFIIVDMGIVDIMENITTVQREQIRIALLQSGFELMADNKVVLIEKVKNTITYMIHHMDELNKKNFSDYISKKINYDYTYLANLFSEVQGKTIEQFIISQKIERIKELIIYDKLTIGEIALKMRYSSVAHLSNQFKKKTGLSPSHFKKLKEKKQQTIDKVGSEACNE